MCYDCSNNSKLFSNLDVLGLNIIQLACETSHDSITHTKTIYYITQSINNGT